MNPELKQDPTRDKLLDEAEKLFAEKGYDAVSVREITAAAGVHLAAVNYHFGSKKNLYTEVFRLRWLDRAKLVRQPIEALDREEHPDLETVIRTIARSLLGNPFTEEERIRHAQLAFREMTRPSDGHDILFNEALLPMLDLIRRLIRKALNRPVDEESLTLCVMSLFYQVLHFSFSRSGVIRLFGREYDDMMIERLVNHITGFTLKGLDVCSD